MKLIGLFYLTALAGIVLGLSGCAGIDPNGYYDRPSAYDMQQVKEGSILCHFPPKDRFHEFYATANTVAACREVGGVPVIPAK